MDKKKTAIFKLESSTWDIKRSQNRNKIIDCPQAILRVSIRVQQTLKIQASKVPKMTLSRKKRDLYQFKQKHLLDQFRIEKSCLDMLYLDGQSLVVRYYSTKWKIFVEEIYYLRDFEATLNSHLHKRYLRLTGYPKSLVESLHERDINEYGNNEAQFIWNIQSNIALILSGLTPIHEISLPNYDKHYPLQTALILLKYGQVLFSKDFNSKVNHKEIIGSYFLFCIQLLHQLEILIYSLNSQQKYSSTTTTSELPYKRYIPMILTQCFRTMRIILMHECQFKKYRTYTPQENIKYNTDICNIFIRWINIIMFNRKYPTGIISQSQNHQYNNQNNQETLFFFETGYISLANHLVCDLFICSKCILQLLLADSNIQTIKHGLYSKDFGHVYQNLSQSLIEPLQSLLLIVLNEITYYSDQSRRITIGDVRQTESIQAEVIACFSCISVIFSLGCLNENLLVLLNLCRKISSDYRYSLAIQSVWLQTFLSATICLNIVCSNDSSNNDVNAINSRIMEAKLLDLRNKINAKKFSNDGEENNQQQDSKSALDLLPLTDQYYMFLGSNIQDLVKLLAYHINSPSIQHNGLLVIRMIMRCPFLSKKEIEIFLEGSALTQSEINEQKKQLKKELKDKFKSTSYQSGGERVIIEPNNNNSSTGNERKIGDEKLVDLAALFENDDDISIESISEWKDKTFDDDNCLIENEEDQLLVNDLGCIHEQILSHGQGGHGGLYYHPVSHNSPNTENKYDIKKKKKNSVQENNNNNNNNESDTKRNGSNPINSNNQNDFQEIDKNHQFLYRTLTELNLSDLLKLVGENNMQSQETMEQWLLLVYQIATGTPLARQTLINSYVDESVAKYLTIQTSDIYLISLCELCLKLLQHH